MSFLVSTLTAAPDLLLAAATEAPTPPPGAGLPDSAPLAPPGLAGDAATVIGWLKWLGLAVVLGAVVLGGAMIAAGKFGRSRTGAEGVTAVGWAIAGAVTIGAAASIVGVFL